MAEANPGPSPSEPVVMEQPGPERGEAAGPVDSEKQQKPCCVIILGMAGSGKTTFVQRLTSHLHSRGSPPYVVNLDPACREAPYPANIDIRDTVNYKQVETRVTLNKSAMELIR